MKHSTRMIMIVAELCANRTEPCSGFGECVDLPEGRCEAGECRQYWPAVGP